MSGSHERCHDWIVAKLFVEILGALPNPLHPREVIGALRRGGNAVQRCKRAAAAATRLVAPQEFARTRRTASLGYATDSRKQFMHEVASSKRTGEFKAEERVLRPASAPCLS